MSTMIGIRELKNQTSRIVRAVREEMAEYVVTVRGEPVAVLRPFTEEDAAYQRQAEVEEELAAMKTLADEIAAAWRSPKSGLELIDEQRRY